MQSHAFWTCHQSVYVTACRSEESLAAAQRTCQEMNENLHKVTQDKQSVDFKTAAELDDLYRTKINLEERLVELIRYRGFSYMPLSLFRSICAHQVFTFSLLFCREHLCFVSTNHPHSVTFTTASNNWFHDLVSMFIM